jgi:hypothetical protein
MNTTQTAEATTRETFYMTQRDTLREGTLRQLAGKLINGTQAAELLRLSVRQVARLKARFARDGVAGILHASRGKPSGRATPEATRGEVARIVGERYRDFGPTLASEKLRELHGIVLCPESVRQVMAGAGLWSARPRRPEGHPHVWRARKDCLGEMEQYDGSYHDWFEGRLLDDHGLPAREQCLLAAIDDATGTITRAEFAESEGVLPTMGFWLRYLEALGKPASVYLDRGSTYRNTPKKNAVKPVELTQFERACLRLGVRLIHARSPQAKGRVERLFQTLQDRLVKELRLAGISTVAAANVFLAETFVPRFNAQFGVAPRGATDLHRPLTEPERASLPSVLSVHDGRRIMADYTVMHETRLYQVEPRQQVLVRTGDQVTVQTRLDGTTAIVKGDAELTFTEILERPRKAAAQKLPHRTTAHAPRPDHPWKVYRERVTPLTAVLAEG